MALYKRPASPQVLDAYKNGVKLFTDAGDALQSVFLDAHAAQHAAHEVFSLGIQHIAANGQGIEKARSVGWRLMAANEKLDLAGACHISETAGGGARFTGLSRVTELKTIFRLIDRFEALPEVHEKRNAPEAYDLRVLRIPGLVEAFWIKSRENSPQDDLVVPFFTRVRDLDPARVPMRGIPMAEFLQKVVPIAEKRLGYSEEHGS